jgi:hypothetical protein
LILGIAIGWGILGNGATPTNAMIPITICNCIGMILVCLFYYFEGKEMLLIRQHIKKKHITMFFVAGFIYIFNIIFIFVYIALIDKIQHAFDPSYQINATFGILFGISSFITLITIGFYRYAKFKIDITMFRRKHGKDDKNNDIPTTEISSGLTDAIKK